MGALSGGLAFVLLSRITALWHLYAVYLLMAMGYSATSLIPVNALRVNWFIHKRGQVMSGLSVGGIVIMPLATFLIARWGLNRALPVLGALFCVGIIPPALFVVKQKPSDVGQFPDGRPLRRETEDMGTDTLRYDYQMQPWTRTQAMHTVSFWAIGPAIAGMIYDATQSYHLAFTLFAGVSLLASTAILFAKPPATAP